MALDEPQEGDEIFHNDGLTFVIDRLLLEMAKPIRIDFTTEEPNPEFIMSSPLLENNCSIAEDPGSCHVSCGAS
jgi:Fe-S cluster assembly iron-binding protein IscA